MHSLRNGRIYYPTFGDFYGVTSNIVHNLDIVRERISDAIERTGRDIREITLIAVSKTVPREIVAAAHQAGIQNFGENRVDEAAQKIPIVNREAHPSDPIIWHMIGHLQSRKAKDAVRLFDFIHSVDSTEIAEHIEKQAAANNKKISVLLEVNTSGEASKYGFPLSEREKFFDATEKILALPHINVVGLMTIAPIVQQPDDARPREAFRALRVLRDELQARHPDHAFPHLSMGMSDDFPAAIAEGATMVRIGRAIFGERK